MDIAGTYEKFRHEQTDAFDPNRRTRFNAFGDIRDEPTVEGFDTWGKNTHVKPVVAPIQIKTDNGDARRRCNMLMRLRGKK